MNVFFYHIASNNKNFVYQALAAAISILLLPISYANEELGADHKTYVEKSLQKSCLCTCKIGQKVIFQQNDIFDLNDDDAIWLHKFANWLHIKTKKVTVDNESAFFLNRCHVSQEDADELERHLRSRRYIRDAKVTITPTQDVHVETWDTWSLMPTFEFSRKGGENKYSYGMQDRNLFGLGINAEIEYFSNAERSGYKFKTRFPLYMQNNMFAELGFSDNNDGQAYHIAFDKPFVSHDTRFNYQFANGETTEQAVIFQNSNKLAVFDHEKQYTHVHFGWMAQDNEQYTLRYLVGFHKEENQYAENPTEAPLSIVLPQNRNDAYPWFGGEYIEKDFRKLQNIHLINHIEDFNFGWHATAQIGLSGSDNQDSAWLYWQSSISKGWAFNQTLVLVNASYDGEKSAYTRDRNIASLSAELFHRFNEKFGFYAKNDSTISNQQYIETPVTLGGDSGLRGYPLQYQHGKNSTLFTTELRYYPKVNLWKILEVGAVAFIDMGKTSGKSLAPNVEDGWLSSVGIGARLFSSHSSEGRVLHIDLAFPQSNNDQVNNAELHITTKYSF